MEVLKKLLKESSKQINHAIWLLGSKKQLKSKINHVLIINQAFIGDILAITPLIHILNKRKIKVDIQVLPEMKPLLENNPDIQNILTNLGSIKPKNYDLIILISPNDPNTMANLSRYTPIIALTQNRISTSSSKLAYTVISSDNRHKVMENTMLLGILGIHEKSNPSSNPLILNISKDETARAKKKFKLPSKFVVLSPVTRKKGSNAEALHSINPIKFSAIADHILNKNKIPIILIGSKGDIALCNEIKNNSSNSNNIINLAGKTSLRELAAIMKLSSLVIGVDSGPIHIASSQNAKIIDLINKRFARCWYPWMPKERYVLLSSKNSSLDSISLEEIESAAEKLLK